MTEISEKIPKPRPQKYLRKIEEIFNNIKEFPNYSDEVALNQFSKQCFEQIENLDVPKMYFKKIFISYGSGIIGQINTSYRISDSNNKARNYLILSSLIDLLNKEQFSAKRDHYGDIIGYTTNLPSYSNSFIEAIIGLSDVLQLKKIKKEYLFEGRTKEVFASRVINLEIQKFKKEVEAILPRDKATEHYKMVERVGEDKTLLVEGQVNELIPKMVLNVIAQIKDFQLPEKYIFDVLFSSNNIERHLNNIGYYLPINKSNEIPVWLPEVVSMSYKHHKSKYYTSCVGLAHDLIELDKLLPEKKIEVLKLYKDLLPEHKDKLLFSYHLANHNYSFFDGEQDWQYLLEWINQETPEDKQRIRVDDLKAYQTSFTLGGLTLLDKLGCTDLKVPNKKPKYDVWFFNMYHKSAWREILQNVNLNFDKKLALGFLKGTLKERLSDFSDIPQVQQALKKLSTNDILDLFPLSKKAFGWVTYSYSSNNDEKIEPATHFEKPLWDNIKILCDIKGIKIEEVLKKIIFNSDNKYKGAEKLIEKFPDDPKILQNFFYKNVLEIVDYFTSKTWHETLPDDYKEIVKNGIVHRKNANQSYSSFNFGASFLLDSNYLSEHCKFNETDAKFLLNKVKDLKLNFNDFKNNAKILLQNNCNFHQEIYEVLLKRTSMDKNYAYSRYVDFAEFVFAFCNINKLEFKPVLAENALALLNHKDFIAKLNLNITIKTKLLDGISVEGELPATKRFKL